MTSERFLGLNLGSAQTSVTSPQNSSRDNPMQIRMINTIHC